MAATQCKDILTYLQTGGKLTHLDALCTFGCARLAARVYDLRKQGYAISKRTIRTPTNKKIAEYSL